MKRMLIAVALISFVLVLVYACGNNNNGVLLLPTTVSLTNFQAASVVIGQPTFTTGDINQGGSAAANTLYHPYGDPLVVDGRLYLPDYANQRVLVFNSIPKANDASGDFVLGQPNMVTTTPGAGANEMHGPQTIKAHNGQFFIDEYTNSRVLIFNTAPTTTQASADIVVGQAGFGSAATACTQTGLNEPESIEVAGGKLIVADSNNNRILIWNTIPTSNGTPADVVLGQNSFTTCKANDDLQTGSTNSVTARTLNYPAGMWSNGTKLIVADASNNRVLIWNHIPTTNFTPADHVLGQGDFTHNNSNDDLQTGATVTSARTLNYPYFLDSNGTQLFVADNGNNRVLVWDSIPSSNFKPANRVLGQGDFTHTEANDDDQDGSSDAAPTARTLDGPAGVYVYGTKLFVTDESNSRYLIFE